MTLTYRNENGIPRTFKGGDLAPAMHRLRKLKDELRLNAHMMSTYEQHKANEAIREHLAEFRPLAVAAKQATFDDLAQQYQKAQKRQEKAKANEAKRWDTGKLVAEQQLAELRLARAESSADVKRAWDDALATGDLHVIRGAAEVFSGALRRFTQPGTPDRFEANRIAKEAQRKADELKITDETNEADAYCSRVCNNLMELKNELSGLGNELEAPQLHGLAASIRVTAKANPTDPDRFIEYTVELVEQQSGAVWAPAPQTFGG